MELINYGESALLANFEQVIDLDVNQSVINLSQQLESLKPLGYKYSIPAYCSLTIVFDPLATTHHEISEKIMSINLSTENNNAQIRSLILPICYEVEMGIDLIELEETLGLSIKEIINIHMGGQYHIYMMGFLPGFAYMGKLDSRIKTSRKRKPRLNVPERSIAIAGQQTGIYPIESPGGWNIIGRTPIPVFDAEQDDPFLFRLGDEVRFRSISKVEYKEIEEEIKQEKFDHQSLIYVD